MIPQRTCSQGLPFELPATMSGSFGDPGDSAWMHLRGQLAAAVTVPKRKARLNEEATNPFQVR